MKLSRAQDQNRQLSGRIEGLNSQLTEVGHDAHTQRQRAEVAEARCSQAEARCSQAEARCSQAEARCSQAEDISRQLSSAQALNSQLSEQIDQIIRSHSWRLTRPLRAIARYVASGHFDSQGHIGLYEAAQRIGKCLPMPAGLRRRIRTLVTKVRWKG